MSDILFGRFTVWSISILLLVGCFIGSYFSIYFLIPMLAFLFLSFIGLKDFLNSEHPVLGNYPLIGRMRYILESIRPELRQYFWESDSDELPFLEIRGRWFINEPKIIKLKNLLVPNSTSMMRATLGSIIQLPPQRSMTVTFAP